ncbi:ABC transporter substrate-binding protein [Deferribacterales bacterium RsTz2092]|nr:ABC transporter substrate-binding protein [Deferribacterales bacterium]GHU85595.1 ABC transporter substrate-binding protein [Deferribacterales bacterium]
MKKLAILLSVCVLIFSAVSCGKGAGAKTKLIVYTSLKESLMSAIKEDFARKYPNIDIDYQSAGAGKLMAKIAAERESGTITANVIWTSEVPDFYKMKEDKLLIAYKPNTTGALNPLEQTDDYFVPARLGTLGIVYNTKKVTAVPTEWKDLFKPVYNDGFAIANPALSGATYVSVAMLQSVFGDQYFKDLRKNKAKVGQGSGQVVDDTASGELVACLGVDYITFDKVEKGATIAMAYPKELLVIPSPIAILKDSKGAQLDASQKFIDYMLTKDAQQIIANTGTLPVREDVSVPEKFRLPTVQEAMTNGIKIDYIKMIAEKEQRVKSFLEIMQAK